MKDDSLATMKKKLDDAAELIATWKEKVEQEERELANNLLLATTQG